MSFLISKHTVVCQQPRKPCDAHTSVLFTGTAKLLLSIPHMSITTGPISIKSHIVCPPFTLLYVSSLKEISPELHKVCVP